MKRFEVGKTYRNSACSRVRILVRILKRTAKTVLIRWTNGYLAENRRVKIQTYTGDGVECELIAFRPCRNSKIKFRCFADWNVRLERSI